METNPAQLAEAFGLRRVSPDVIDIPAQLRRVTVQPIFFAIVAAASVLMILYPGHFSNDAAVLIGSAGAVFAIPMLALSLIDLFRGGPRITLTPSGFTIHRQIWRRAYQWEEVGSFAVEEMRMFGFIRIVWVSFESGALEENRSWLRRFFGRRETLLKSPVGNAYPYAMPPENLVRLLNAFVARYGSIPTS